MSEDSTVESNGTDDVAGGTGLSGVHRTVRCIHEATAISTPTALCRAFNVRSARAEVRRAHTGTPDSKQYLSGVHRTPRRAHKSESFNGQNPTAVMTWQGAPDCPVYTGLSGAPSNRQVPNGHIWWLGL